MLSDYLPKTPQRRTGLSGYSQVNKPDLSTSDGLYNYATQSGLQGQADRILKEKGEQTKQIFSGGFITDIFDALNAVQYGVVGVMKGKGFREGVKTRQSWSDKDALGEHGIPGMIGGIALDIACDPLTYIPPIAIAKRLGLVGKIKKMVGVTEKTKVGKFLGSKFVYRFGEDPIYKMIDERRIKNIAVGQRGIQDIIEPIIRLPAKTSAKLLTRTKTGSFIRTPLKGLTKELSKDELWNLSKSYSILDDLGKQAVDSGLMSRGTWEANLGEYIKNAYTKYDVGEKATKGLWSAAKRRIRGTSFMARQDAFGVIFQPARFTIKITKKFTSEGARDAFLKDLVSPKFAKAGGKVLKKFDPLTLAKRKELGEITNPAYLLAKSMMDIHLDVENAKLFQSVVRKGLGSKVMREGYVNLPTTNKLGELSGMFVPKPLADSIQEIIRSRGAWEKTTGKVVAGFKFGKVIMNPATHGRNIISNTVLNWWKLGLGPWRADRYTEAVKEVATKGKWYKEAVDAGMDTSTYAYQEINSLLLGPDTINAFGKGKKLGHKIVKKLGDVYQGEEEMAKMAAFIHLRKGGKATTEAWNLAESATFNYAQITPFIRRVRESLFGFPFITFCVSPDTEILTDKGWKTFDLVDTKNDTTLAYDIKTKELKWQKIENVFVFPYVGKMLSVKSRSLDILMTPDHRNVIERTLHRRKTGNKKEQIIIEANKLTKADSIIVAGNYQAPTSKTIDNNLVELVGWLITEGYIVKKSNGMFIGQTNKEGQRKIEDLRKRLGVEKYNCQLRKYKLGGYKPHKVYYFPAKIRDKVLELSPNKKLRVEFLKQLTKEQLELLYQTILLADGHNPINKKSNPIIIQNPGETANSIQILGVMLGKQFGWTKHDNGLGITITKGYKRQLKRNLPQKVNYAGIVWCPKTELGTWVARRNGKVFITGNTYKATPLAIETALKHPQRISSLGKIKQAIESQSDIKKTERERASEPSWVRDGFYIKLPIEDKHGRSAYFDLTYIIPFGDVISGDFWERKVGRETGVKEGMVQGLARKSPFFNLVKELSSNQDFYGNKIWKDGDDQHKQLGDIMRHLTKMYSPPLLADQIPGGYIAQGKYQGQRRPTTLTRTGQAAEGTQYRTLMQEMMRNVGLKVQPIDADIQDTYMEWEKKKALQTLLKEAGLISGFELTYKKD